MCATHAQSPQEYLQKGRGREWPEEVSCAAARKAMCPTGLAALSCPSLHAPLGLSGSRAQNWGQSSLVHQARLSQLCSPRPHPGDFHQPQFTDKETEAQRGKCISPSGVRAGGWRTALVQAAGSGTPYPLPFALPCLPTGVALPEPSWAVGLWRRLQRILQACPQMTSHLPSQSLRGQERCLSREVGWLCGPGFTGQGSVWQPGSLEERPGGAHPIPPPCSGPQQLPETEPSQVTASSREEATHSPSN